MHYHDFIFVRFQVGGQQSQLRIFNTLPNLTCEQLALEALPVSSHAIAASGVQDKKAGNDAAAMAVGLGAVRAGCIPDEG
ncbi:hypothetical protein [Sinorhizobium chiapasense]|uniref:Uncharacterized protein n=1 Tax=Sinorhizobium chiapasense TaxID=501572 RepID=A0ABZ2BL49_9HYPH